MSRTLQMCKHEMCGVTACWSVLVHQQSVAHNWKCLKAPLHQIYYFLFIIVLFSLCTRIDLNGWMDEGKWVSSADKCIRCIIGVRVTCASFTHVYFPVSSFQGNSAQHQSEANVHLLSLRDENLPDLRKEAGARCAAWLFWVCQPVSASSAPHARPDF